MANTEMLRCIRKNIGYVCADGYWSSAEILENSLVLAKMQILQNARRLRLRGLRFFLMRPKALAKTRRTGDSAISSSL